MSSSNIFMLASISAVAIPLLVFFSPNRTDALIWIGIIVVCAGVRYLAREEDHTEY